MKRIFLLFSLVAICCSASAQRLQLVSGDVGVMKEKVTANCVFDFDTTQWEWEEDFKDWCGSSYAKRVKGMTQAFIDSFNKTSKRIKITDRQQEAPYTMVVKAQNFSRSGMSGWGWGRFHISITARITMIDNATGKELCQFSAHECAGSTDYVEDDRLYKCCNALAKGLAKNYTK